MDLVMKVESALRAAGAESSLSPQAQGELGAPAQKDPWRSSRTGHPSSPQRSGSRSAAFIWRSAMPSFTPRAGLRS